MKQIKIEISFNNRGKHTIFLGRNQSRLEHKSKRFIRDYIIQYKRVITDNVRILNNLAIQTHTLYRLFYFELDDKTARKVKKSLTKFEDKFDYIFQSFSEGNQNAFVFSSIEVCICNLSESLYYLKKFSGQYKNYSLKHQVNSYLKMLSDLELQFIKDKQRLDLSQDYGISKLSLVVDTNSKMTG